MKRYVHLLALFAALSFSSCVRENIDQITPVPDGTPITLALSFGSPAVPTVEIGTRAEATDVDESHIHDLYVFIFKWDADTTKLYGRYFSYEHQTTKALLDGSANECWFVENKTINGVANPVSTTRGAVKIATSACEHATIVLLANISNTLTKMDGEDPIERLNAIRNLEELKNVQVQLVQDVVSRKDYFLMMDVKRDVNTGNMRWNQEASPTQYNDAYRLELKRLDAKVKFRIKANTTNISKVTPRFWQVCKAPAACYLFPAKEGGPDSLNPEDDEKFESFDYFDTEETYFEGTETDGGDTYHVFCFYMLENRLRCLQHASYYRQREKQVKEAIPGKDYGRNGAWEYANENSTYVRFDVILTLEKAAIQEIDPTANQAMTTDVAFVVHLGNFGHSDRANEGLTHDFDNYNTSRDTCYTYNITIVNSTSIYSEVILGNEIDPAQEGFLLLIKEGVINCDAHYEYRSMVFNYRPDLNPNVFSWYVKTPFCEGGASPRVIDAENGVYYYTAPSDIIDYKWVLYALNDTEVVGGKTVYKEERKEFPGNDAYHPTWKLGAGAAAADSSATRPDLLDISQLISFIFYEQTKETKVPGSSLFDDEGQIRLTAFVDEYYYETDPVTGEVNPELWRTFVNAKPREMHILSDAETSWDQKSDVISSSQSIIQQSIQTIYNIYDHELTSIWGTEHKDEMRDLAGAFGWGFGTPVSTSGVTDENGRWNSAALWGARNATPDWSDYLYYQVSNDTPELREDNGHQAMAFSCMTRNRDNNGNGKIDSTEVRWYLASINQLIGMYIGGDALSLTARLYQPFAGQWRAHIVSSSYPKVLTSEEGIATYDLGGNWMDFADYVDPETGETITIDQQKNRIRSVRCVRNVGTYDAGGGTRKDFSYAPFNRLPDKYFTVDTIGSGSSAYYKYYFNRLDPKALRPYASGELPYHDEHSSHNRVYLTMTTQSADQDITIPADVRHDEVNQIVSDAGVNPYCPPGYRIPNQVELALMTMTVNRSVFLVSPHPVHNVASRYFCRTYYSKGWFGDQTPSEASKVGWVFGGGRNINCSPRHDKNGDGLMARCVKDIDMTGTIMGDIVIPQDTICPGEKLKTEFKFFSSASTFQYASLKLLYELSGVHKEKEILLDKEPSGVQYLHTQDIEIPTLETLGVADLPAEGLEMTLSFELRNINGRDTTVNKVIRMLDSHMTASMRLLTGWETGRGFPVEISARSFSSRYPITGLVISVQDDDDTPVANDLVESLPDNPKYIRQTVYVVPSPEAGHTYTITMHATCADGDHIDYQGSIDILRANFDPATETVDRKWVDTATGLDFERGDFIEARINVPTTGSPTAKQGILSVGNPTIKHFSYSDMRRDEPSAPDLPIYGFHAYYYDGGYYLRFAEPHGYSTAGSTTIKKVGGKDYTITAPVTLRFDYDGLYYNNIFFGNWSGESWYSEYITTIRGYSSVLVGQNQGTNRTQATYPYIRVTHQAEKYTPAP